MTKARDIASAIPAPSTVSSAELGFLDGVTSAIQTQIDTKAPSSTAVTLTGTQTLTNKTLTNPVIASVVNNTLTSTTGDMIYASAANTPARLGIGSSAQVLTVASGVPSWATPAGGTGAISLIASGTLSGTSFTWSSLSTYSELILLIYGVNNGTANATYGFRVNNNTGTNYYIVGSVDVNGITTTFSDNVATSFYHSRDTNRTTTNTFALKLTNTKTTGFTDVDYRGFVIGDNGQPYDTKYLGTYTVAETVSSLVMMQYGGGSFTAGTYALYGG